MKLLLFVLTVFISGVAMAQPKAVAELGTNGQHYGESIRYLGGGKAELWSTATNGSEYARSRKIVIAGWVGTEIGASKDAKSPVNAPLGIRDSISLDGSPTFGCDPNYFVFVSNRLINGKSFGNDLYEAVGEGDGWHVKRIDTVSSDQWDDTPALSWDGNLLFFASDRRMPGRGLSDIYVSTRVGTEWSKPKMLSRLTSDGDRYTVETPFLSRDGFLYFSTNETLTGHFAIRRVAFDTISNETRGAIDTSIVPGVNKDGSNSGHPWISPGGKWMLFASDRDTVSPKLRIYSIALPQNKDSASLHLTVLERTHHYDAAHNRWNDVILPASARVSCNPIDGNLMTDARGEARIPIPQQYSESPAQDIPFLTLYLGADAVPSNPSLIGSHDTLILDASRVQTYDYTLYLWDTGVYYSRECSTDFKVRDIPFFIRGYWCPTSTRYDTCLSCASVFLDSSCVRVSVPAPTLPCKPADDLRVYKLDYRPPTVDVSEPAGLCINHEEWKDSSRSYANRVDSVLDLYVEEMQSVFSKEVWCIERAIERGDTIQVEVIGWTDPGSLSDDCIYTGSDIDVRDNAIHLIDMTEKKYIENGIIRHGTNFVRTSKRGTFGNELLADLRAYFTAQLLDSLWDLKIPRYRELRERGAIKLIANGGGISTREVAMN
ncbi:MAG TPA: hypothetical protein VGM92_00140, partial [Candidatus Kapabacteria bacterium]